MHPRSLIELGARTALAGPRWVRTHARISPTGVQEYWAASRARFQAWSAALKPYEPGRSALPLSPDEWSARLRPLLEEIFTGELLTRTWTAIAIHVARRQAGSDLEPMLRGVLLSHLELRNQALNCVVFGIGTSSRRMVSINQLRRRVEHWIDLLFGEMLRTLDVAELAHDPRRAKDYARASAPKFNAPDRADGSEAALVEAIGGSFDEVLSTVSLHPELNRRLADSVLAGFQGPWAEWLERSAGSRAVRADRAGRDALLWIDDMLRLDNPSGRTELRGDDETAARRRGRRPPRDDVDPGAN